jgi:hypothetical protein
VVKDYVEPKTEQLLYGEELHKAAELYIKDGTPLPEQFSFIKSQLDTLNAIDGQKLCEYKMGLTASGKPCGFLDKDVWWRGIADLIVLRGDKAYVVDYKTSKSAKYADTKQLEILSLALFKHYPQVRKIKAGLLFVVANDFVTTEYEKDNAGTYWTRWIEDVNRLEKAVELNVWNPRPNFTCGQWCPVKDCIHNGKGEYR